MGTEFDSMYGTIMAGAKRNGLWLGMSPIQRAEYAGRISTMVQNYLNEQEQIALTNGLNGKSSYVNAPTVTNTPAPAVSTTQTTTTQVMKENTKLSDKVKVADKIKVGTAKKGFKYYLIGKDGTVYEVSKEMYNSAKKGKIASVRGAQVIDATSQKLPQKIKNSSDKITQKYAETTTKIQQNTETGNVRKYGKGWGKIQHPSNTELGTANPDLTSKTRRYISAKSTEVSGVVEADRRAAEIIKRNAEHNARQAEYDKMAQEYREMKDKRWQQLAENKGKVSGVVEADRRATEIIKRNAEHNARQAEHDKMAQIINQNTGAKQGNKITNLIKKFGKINIKRMALGFLTLGIGFLIGRLSHISKPADSIMTNATNNSAELSNTPVETSTSVDSAKVSEIPATIDETKNTNHTTQNLILNQEGKYTVKKGDSFWKIAEQHLQDKYKDEPDKFINLSLNEKNQLIQTECERIMRLNKYWYDDNHNLPVPMLHSTIQITIKENLDKAA